MQTVKENRDNDKKYRDSIEKPEGLDQHTLYALGMSFDVNRAINAGEEPVVPYTPAGEIEYFTE